MAKKDRYITFDELWSGHCSLDYLDIKEKYLVACRRLRKLCDEFDETEDCLTVFTEDEEHPNKSRLMAKQKELRPKIEKQKDKVNDLKKQLISTY